MFKALNKVLTAQWHISCQCKVLHRECLTSHQSFYYWITRFSLSTCSTMELDWGRMMWLVHKSAQMAQKAEIWEQEQADSNNSTEWLAPLNDEIRETKSSDLGQEIKRQTQGEDSKYTQAKLENSLTSLQHTAPPGLKRPELAAADTERLLSWPRKDLSLLSHSGRG